MAKKIPFNFVLDYLYPINFELKSMFGVTTVYVNDKIVLGLREKVTSAESNGIWIATTKVHHESLKAELPSISSIPALGNRETGWQLLASSDDDFEEHAIKICELIKQNDPRIGKIPKPKKKKTKTPI
jgi:hypothetical protein